MKEPSQLPFQAGQGYRRRRLIDAIRLVPMVGLLAFILPVLWTTAGEGAALTSRGGAYVFGVWAVLIIVAAGFSRAVDREGARDRSDAADPDAGTSSGRDPG